MSKILILPDIHGRDFWKEPCQHIDEFDKVICLGDYHDPYPFQVGKDTSRHMLRDEFVPFVEAHKDKFICLYGNHDCNYIYDVSADRYDKYHALEIERLLAKLDLQLIYKQDGYLFSHSGVLPFWLESNGLTLDDLNNIEASNPALYQVSPYRGGWTEAGSCIWGDVREYDESKHIPNLYQIFGHTQMYDCIIKDDYACLDCRKAFILNTETKELKEYENSTN